MSSLFLRVYLGLQELKNHEEGQTMVEYGLLAALISLAAMAFLPGIANSLQTIFSNISSSLVAA